MIASLVLTVALSGSAFACEDGKGHASGSSCHMPQNTASAELPADGTRSRLAVDGMHCGACADKVHAALMGVEGVKGAKVDLAAKTVDVAYDDKKVNLDALLAAVNATGKYKATLAKN